MSHAAAGRHRAAEPSRRPTPRDVWAAVVVLLVIVGLGVFLVWPKASPTATPRSPAPSEPTLDDSPSLGAPTPTVESSRDVTVDGPTITVEEVSTVLDGTGVRAVPAESVPLGLELVDTSVVTPDGRTTDFNAPVTLDPSGSLTVRSRYRLTDCPDVIPTQWPSPTEFPEATRTYLRLDGPLHTAYAVCPDSTPVADPLPELSGAVVPGGTARVRLSWLGTQTLTIKAIGAASGVAALVPNPDCDASCISFISPGGSTTIQLAPVDPCPPATDSDRLTLVVQLTGKVSTVAVDVVGLSKVICS